MEKLDLFISVKPKPKQPSKVSPTTLTVFVMPVQVEDLSSVVLDKLGPNPCLSSNQNPLG